jgi:diguanylate cyclase (GGDEF)-like protein
MIEQPRLHDTPAAQVLALVDRGRVAEAVALAERALPAAVGPERAAMLVAQSAAYVSAGRQLDALRAAAAASDVFKRQGDHRGLCDALVRVGSALRSAGDHASAISALEEAESIARELGDEPRRALVLRHIGVCCSLVGRHQQALSYLAEALELHFRLGLSSEALTSRLSYYNARNRQAHALPADHPERQAALRELLDLWQALAQDAQAQGLDRMAVMARGNHGITLQQSGRYGEAIAVLETLLEQYRASGMTPNVAIALNVLGRCHAALGSHAVASRCYHDSLAILGQDGSMDDRLEAYEGLSLAEEAQGHLADALAALRQARALDKAKTDEAARTAAAQRELRIELARLTSQWAAQAAQDPLTGLGNRRALDRWMGENLPRAERGQPLTLLLLDIDHFKSVNDRFGHAVGDAVLRRVAKVVASRCRERDLAVRYGGEEFVLGLTSLGHDDAVALAHELRDTMASQPWAEIGPGLTLSVSIGTAHATHAANAQELLTLADRRLYAAKYAGRNRVVSID